MYVGYQDERIVYVAETKTEIENLPCVVFDKIEEVSEEYVLVNGNYVTKGDAMRIQNQNKIEELKLKLSETDYVVIKIAEGEATAEEYSEVLANRKAWRSEINELEK